MGFYLKKQKPYEYSDEKLKSNSEILLIITQSPGRLATHVVGSNEPVCIVAL